MQTTTAAPPVEQPIAPKRKYEIWHKEYDAEGHPHAKVDFGKHWGQQRTMDSKARFVLMLSGTQGGKTSFGPWWLCNEIGKRGGGDYLAATTNYDLFKLKMLPEIRYVFEDVLQIGRYHPGDKIMEIREHFWGKFLAKTANDKMWARIILRSAEAPSGLESATANAAWLDEVGMDEWDITTFEAVLRRVSLAQGRILGTSTIYNTGWIKSEWYDRWIAGDKDYDVIQFASTANPSFSIEEFERAKRTMPDYRFGMFYDARFTKPEGLIYSSFDDATMVIHGFDETRYALHEPRLVGIDPGGQNTASLYIIHDTTVSPSVFYVYEEHLEGGMSAQQHSKLALDRVKGLRDVKWIGGAAGEIQFRADWQACKVPVYAPEVTDVESGIANIIELFMTKRLFISDKCKGLRHELNTYRRRMLPDGTFSEVIENKANYHRLDALRYALGSPQLAGWESLRGIAHVDNFENKWGDPTRGRRAGVPIMDDVGLFPRD